MDERVSLYSSSLYEVALEEGCAKEVADNLCFVKALLEENGDYIKIISSPIVDIKEREKLLDEAFSENVHPYVLNFMKVLCKKRIFGILPSVAESFTKEYFRDNNIECVTITTAIELSVAKKDEMLSKLSEATGKNIRPQFVVDERILGGIVIETENATIDGSITGKLESIKRHISKI